VRPNGKRGTTRMLACYVKMGSLRPGMSIEQVKATAPCLWTDAVFIHRNTTETSASRREQWAIYDEMSDPISLGYLYFENGSLTAIERRQ
jgi:hypothetical protein